MQLFYTWIFAVLCVIDDIMTYPCNWKYRTLFVQITNILPIHRSFPCPMDVFVFVFGSATCDSLAQCYSNVCQPSSVLSKPVIAQQNTAHCLLYICMEIKYPWMFGQQWNYICIPEILSTQGNLSLAHRQSDLQNSNGGNFIWVSWELYMGVRGRTNSHLV